MIGIVGGVGPLAGLDIFKKITEETNAARDQDHASVLLFSVPGNIPDRTAYLLGKEITNPAYALSQILFDMETAGARVAAIPCNTAHADPIFGVIVKELKKNASRLVLLNMIQEVLRYLRQEYADSKIGILCTNGTREIGIYRNALEEAGFEIAEPDDAWQQRVHEATYNSEYGVKAHSSPVKKKAYEEYRSAVEHLKQKGAAAVILGCSEIPLALQEKHLFGVDLIDPNRILARALLVYESTSEIWRPH